MSGRRQVFAALVGITLAGQLAAVGYEILVARQFGTGLEADALALALILVIAMANEIVAWISALFIPHYLDARMREGTAAARGFFRASLALVVAGTAVLALVFLVGAPALAELLAPTPAVRRESAHLLRLFAPVLVLLPASTLLAGVLQAGGRFIVASLRQLCWYGAALASVLALGGHLGASAVPAGMVLGLAVFAAALALAIRGDERAGAREPVPPRIRRVLALLVPLALASASNYVNILVERGLAARLPEGSLAALTYASRLLSFPLSLFLLNATTMLFPALALHAARDDRAELTTLVRHALRLTLVFTMPLAVLAITLAEPAIAVLLEHGAFTAESTRLTAAALAWYAPGIVGMAGVQILSRAYQALHEVPRMVVTGIAVTALNIALMVILTALLGFTGLPLATSASGLALFLTMLLAIRPRLPGLGIGAVVGSAGRALLAGTAAAGCVFLLRSVAGGSGLARLASGSLAGLLAYALVLRLLSRDDLYLALRFVVPGWAPAGS